jgi:SAM-dependent methyltransferase
MTHTLPLDLLACPVCRTPLTAEPAALICASCGARYNMVGPVIDLVPSDMQTRIREGGDAAWSRWREAIRGLEQWRAKQTHDAGRAFDDGTSERAIQALFERAKVAGTVVDVGAKDGAKSRLMKDLTRYVGVDPFASHASGLAEHAVVVRGMAEALPLRDRVADAVVSISAFDYFHDGFNALEEMARVLKPNGRLAMLVSVVSSTVAHARGGRTRWSRVTSGVRAARDIGLAAAAGLVGTALLERDRAHTHYYTRNQVTSMVSVKFDIEGIEESRQSASTILYIHARKKRTARLPVLT